MNSIISCSTESQHGLNARRKAIVLFKSKRYEEAIALIDIAIQIDPHCFRNYLNRSICLDALSLYQESLADAIIAFNIASESKCLGLRLFIRLAESQIKVENFDEAKRILRYATLFEQQGFSKQDSGNENLKMKIDEIRRSLERNFRVLKESSNQITIEEYMINSRSIHTSNRARTASGGGASSIRSLEISSVSSSKLLPSGSSTLASSPEKHSPYKTSTNSMFLPPISPHQRIKTQFPNYAKQQILQSHQLALDKFNSKKEEAIVKEFEEEYIKKFNIEKSKVATLISFLGTSDMRNEVHSVDDNNGNMTSTSSSSKNHKSNHNHKKNHDTTSDSKSSSKSNSINYGNNIIQQELQQGLGGVRSDNLSDICKSYSEMSSEAFFVHGSQQDLLSIHSSHSTSSSSSSEDENDEFDEESVGVGVAPASSNTSRQTRSYTHSTTTTTLPGSKTKALTHSSLGTGLGPSADRKKRESSSQDLNWRQATPGPRFVLNLDELTGFNRFDEELVNKK